MSSSVLQNLVNKPYEHGFVTDIEADKAPIVNGVTEERMRVGCGSATIGMFAKLKSSIEGPLKGMATAFGASLFGARETVFMPPPATTAKFARGQWSRLFMLLIFGVRPNSPQTTTDTS